MWQQSSSKLYHRSDHLNSRRLPSPTGKPQISPPPGGHSSTHAHDGQALRRICALLNIYVQAGRPRSFAQIARLAHPEPFSHLPASSRWFVHWAKYCTTSNPTPQMTCGEGGPRSVTVLHTLLDAVLDPSWNRGWDSSNVSFLRHLRLYSLSSLPCCLSPLVHPSASTPQTNMSSTESELEVRYVRLDGSFAWTTRRLTDPHTAVAHRRHRP